MNKKEILGAYKELETILGVGNVAIAGDAINVVSGTQETCEVLNIVVDNKIFAERVLCDYPELYQQDQKCVVDLVPGTVIRSEKNIETVMVGKCRCSRAADLAAA